MSLNRLPKATLPVFCILVGTINPLLPAGEDHGKKEELELHVGRTAGGQLAVEFASDEPIQLQPVSGLLDGWGGDVPGLGSLAKDEPAEDLFTLATGASVALQVVSFDPAFRGITPGFASVFQNPGDTWLIGGPEFDEHPFWHINSSDPSFDADQTVWQATFRFIDMGTTGYAPSDQLALQFTNVPEPGTWLLLAIGCMAIARRNMPIPTLFP